ncbi:MAG: heat-inducible transcription repressor HrcA [Anaerolineae bacterium]|nr:heat-inducible transcription repressor HrcA [Anaerolineae bacterium]
METDAADLPELTERQERILSLIVREYSSRPDPEPVGSKFLAETYLENVSSATVRNEMARLEELGLLSAPHTSAGRVPTAKGYRYFVRRLLNEQDRELPAEEKESIARRFDEVHGDPESWLPLAASTLAEAARGAALVTSPTAMNSQYKHLALISTHGPIVMMVLVLQSGYVRQQVLTLAEALPQESLTAIANRLNGVCAGLTGELVRTKARTMGNELDREILEVAADAMSDVDSGPGQIVYHDGLSDVLPEFREQEGARQVLRVMEERSALQHILSDALNHSIGQVAVIIAGDGRWDEVRHLGLVLSRYGVRGQALGSLVVIGPTRMRYGRAISAVGYVAGLMSNLMIRAYGSPDAGE